MVVKSLGPQVGAELLWSLILLVACVMLLMLVVVAGASIARRYGRTPPGRRSEGADPDDWSRKPLVSRSAAEQDRARDE
jgi:hypothetical protein